MTLLTIFTAPKPFVDPHIATIQRNAFRSWQQLGSDVQIMAIGDEKGLAEIASELGIVHLPQVECTPGGTPLISSIFRLARENSESPMLAYLNADIIVMENFLAAARLMMELANQFLLIGRRWDLDVRAGLDFTPGWEERLREQLKLSGRLHPPMGSDYFLFPRGCFTEIPDFAVGRAGWDNWMIYHSRRQGWLTVEGTPSITIIHQQHDYSHLLGQVSYTTHPESDENRRLAGGRLNTRYTLADANTQLKNSRIRPAKWTLPRLLRHLELWFLAHNDPPKRLFTVLYNRFYAWRTKLQTH